MLDSDTEKEAGGQVAFESRQVSDKFLVGEMAEKLLKWYNYSTLY